MLFGAEGDFTQAKERILRYLNVGAALNLVDRRILVA